MKEISEKIEVDDCDACCMSFGCNWTHYGHMNSVLRLAKKHCEETGHSTVVDISKRVTYNII